MEVSYQFQLEVNNVETTGTTLDVLGDIDLDILDTLQETLPNGQAASNAEEPNVKFERVSSEIFSACFTKSEQCSLIRSTILVSYKGQKPEHSVEKVTLNLVQEYLKNFSTDRSTIEITYEYPSAVSSLAHFAMGPVWSRMRDVEISVMESTFLEVFGAIVEAMEGDTIIQDAQFLYQDLFEMEERRRTQAANTTSNSNITTTAVASNETDVEPKQAMLEADIQITGYCRECTSQQFEEAVNGVITQNLIAFQNKLKVNGASASSDYFEDVTELTYKIPELPSKQPPIEDESIFDFVPPKVDRVAPWFLFLGIGIGMCVLLVGGFVVYAEKTEFEKEECSTGGSDDEEEENAEESVVGGEEEGTNYAEEASAYNDLEDYQVETIAPAESGNKSDYEVYVF
jgi:hypothetical protein